MTVVKITTNSIKLGQFLKFIGEVSMGGEVKDFIENSSIKVNQNEEKQRGKSFSRVIWLKLMEKSSLLRLNNGSKKS